MSYNGWTNYETWNWKRWIDNEEGWQETVLDAARDFKGTEGDGSSDVYGFSRWLEDDCENLQDMYNLPTTGPFADLLGAAIGSINFYEIADAILEELG